METVAPSPVVTRVSVITPFLNAEAHLAEAIASVRAQTVTDWELLLVDDGSTDASPAIAAAAAASDARIRLMRRQPDARPGAAAARNDGITAARGEFVAFLDADDLYEPHMLATALAATDRHPTAAMVYGRTRWWYAEGGRPDWIEGSAGRAGRLHRPPSLLGPVILLQEGHVPCICSALVRRSAAQAVRGFDDRFRLYEDQTLWVKLFSRFDVYVSPDCLSRYRQHSGSTSALAATAGQYDRNAAHPARAAFLDWVGAELRTDGPVPQGVARALRLAASPYSGDRSLRNKLDRWAFALNQAKTRQRRRLRRRLARVLSAARSIGGAS